jgi:hypothetical protein
MVAMGNRNRARAEIWGVKTHDPFSQPPSTLFHFAENGTNLVSVGIVTLNGSQIEVDGLALSKEEILYGFHLSGSGSELITIDANDATAVVVGQELMGREIRGAVITADSRMIVLDATNDEILEIDLSNGGILDIFPSLIFDTEPLSISNVSDIVQQPDGTLLMSAANKFYLLDVTSANTCLGYRDEMLTQGNVVGISGLAFSSEGGNNLFTYDVNHDDDIYSYDINNGYNRFILYPNIISSYNAGRGDLAAIPIVVNPGLKGDASLNGQVGNEDLLILHNNWLQNACGKTQADFNLDGIVDLYDFAILSGNWMM